MIIILGPTASGKTQLATHLAKEINGEIISADSRQVYKDMDIGTGKDLDEYLINGHQIPYHLIDICEPGTKYLLPDFQRDFKAAYQQIKNNNHTPILCGGTGLYFESILENHIYTQVPENTEWRASIENSSHEELLELFNEIETNNEAFSPDLSTRKRTIRAIEIVGDIQANTFTPIIFGLDISREERRSKISIRLKERLENGLIEEVQQLLSNGVSSEELKYYGLEYKFVVEHLEGKWNSEELFKKLEVAIHQYAKRQMTWFRRMEKNEHQINWISTKLPTDQKINIIKNLIHETI